MVIAGMYIAILLSLSIDLSTSIFLSDLLSLSLYSYAPLISLSTILHSFLLSLSIADIKSIIAYSIIGQIAYISLNSSSSSSSSLSHIFVHSYYKCFLFLLSAEVIHQMESN